jgi:replicative DNA helicase
VLVALCQLNREIEGRTKFVPQMSDLRDTGQLEQDADVIMFGVWPHRIDPKNDPYEYQFFIAKNRNRAINDPAVKVRFEPSRQMFLHQKIEWQTYEPGKPIKI